MEWQGGKLESDCCDATGPRPIWTSTCVHDDLGRSEAWCNAWLQWLRRFGSTHTEACRERLEKALADERADPVGTPLGPITEPAISEYLAETTLAFVEALGHNVVMLHSDQELVLVQMLKTAQSKRVERTSVRHGPRTSHQSQSKIENVNQVINGVCWSMWLSLENLLRDTLSNDSILLAWLIRHTARSLTKFQVKNDGRTAFLRVAGKAYTSQLPFGERVMYKHTAVPTGNLNQRWCHGIWVGKAPMSDECIILTENGVLKAKSLHRVPTEEKFLISELEKAREFPWNDVAENLKSAIETRIRTKIHLGIGVCV